MDSAANQARRPARLYLASPAEVRVNSKLYERVREARKLTGLTQEALALDLGVTRSAVAQWEMAEGTAPALEHLIALARRSGLHFEYLATGRGERVFGEPMAVDAAAIGELPSHYQFTDQQLRLLERFDSLSPRQRAGLLDLLDTRKSR
ncbi:helix-turn-helix transcriptional regulator [uncultured Xanthomonas sp.]|uniref:helix-turn-helix transcriptional regulator n=1 Tax=uncultured Xanthomonas sp. TaxID=152831 RepID=UPI0037478B34